MKQVLLTAIIIFYLLHMDYAQSSGTLVAGATYATFRHNKAENGLFPGWFVGFQFSKTLDKNFFLKTIPQYTQIGSTIKTDTLKGFDQLNYFKLPVRFQQQMVYNNYLWFFEAGPYIAISSGGKEKFEGYEAEPIYSGGDNFLLSPIDFGLGIGVGTKIKNAEISAGFDFGIPDIHQDSKIIINNRTLYLSLGFSW